MTMFLAWQGSEVRRVEVDATTVRVLLSAASVSRAASDHGGRSEEGFLRPLTVVFSEALVRGDLASALGSLADVALEHAGRAHQPLALPFLITGPVQAELRFRNGTVLRIEAKAVSCTPAPDSRFFESMAC